MPGRGRGKPSCLEAPVAKALKPKSTSHKGGVEEGRRKEQLGTEGYQEMESRGGQSRKDQQGREGYQEMGRKGGRSIMDKSGGERAAEEGIEIDRSKFRTSIT